LGFPRVVAGLPAVRRASLPILFGRCGVR
jgi:hypothetical protein